MQLPTLRLGINETDEVSMDRQQMERCLEQVAAYRASGQKAKAWAEAHGVALGTLGSWCAHAGRWRAKLEGVVAGRSPAPGRAASWLPAWRRAPRRHRYASS